MVNEPTTNNNRYMKCYLIVLSESLWQSIQSLILSREVEGYKTSFLIHFRIARHTIIYLSIYV